MSKKKSPQKTHHRGFAKKNLGQNFLNSTEVRDNILKHAGDISGKKILEIGPGLGYLTAALLKAKADLTAIELDERACEILQKDFEHKKSFHLINGSILETNLDKIFTEPYGVIANIPYNITNPIIKKLLAETKNQPDFCILMVQKEVAEKIARNKKQKRSLLSISVEIFAEAEYLFTVDRIHFTPSPNVDSAILKLTTRPHPLVEKTMEKDFFTLVNAGFNERRKKLGNHIGKFFGIDPNLLLDDIDPNKRAEELSIQDWIEITKRFQALSK